MTEEAIVPAANEATVETPTPATPSAGTQKAETPAEVMIPKSRLDEVLSKLKTYEQEKTKAQKDAEAAETARLAEQGKYKEIADALQAKLDAAATAAKSAELRLLQRDVAAKTGLPAALAERLRGEDEADMIADAKSILQALPKPAAPNINAESGAGGAPLPGQMSEAEKQELAAVFGVNPKFM